MKVMVLNKTIGRNESTGEYVDVPVGDYELVENDAEKSVVVIVEDERVRITRRVTR